MWEHRQRRRAETVVLLSEIKHGDFVLDIGCGDGKIIKMFGDSGSFTVGLDKSLEVLKKAKSKLIASNIDLCHGIAEKLPFRPLSFDKILMLELLEHVPNPRACIKEADNCAKDNAIVLISVPWKEKLRAHTVHMHGEDDEPIHRWRHIHSFNEANLISLMPDYYRLLTKKHLPNAYIHVFTWLPLLKKLPFKVWHILNDVLGNIKKGYWAFFKFRKCDAKK